MEKEYHIVNDEGMYDYFYDLLNGKLDFLISSNDKKKKGTEWQKSLISYNFEQIYETRRAVYSEKEVCNELCIMDDILQIFQTFFCIPGIDRLWINNYGAIENDIFLEYDANNGKPKKIREHCKHQYRNVYLGSLLMLEYGFLNAMTDCILNSKSLLASYIKSLAGEKENEIKKVLYQSYYLSAMFHDIGYPLVFFLRKAKEIHQYAPFYKIISSSVKTEFTEIKAILAESILFQIVPEKKIEEKYVSNDHGCLSAISFLLNFYSTGSIFALETTERCIVETTGLAIYRHTDHLENDYMIFEEDPLSYMVRLCDDLQEWERFLMVINDKHNFLKCTECGSIVKAEGRSYHCECGARFEKITHIINKKVNYISLCNSLKLFLDKDKNELEIYLDFDYYKQIEIILDDYTSVKKRHEDIEKIKQYLEYQKYIPNIKVNACLSNNPICLIENFLEEKELSISVLKEEEEKNRGLNEAGRRKALKFLEEIEFYIQNKTERERKFGKEIEEDIFVYGENAILFVEEYLGQIHSLMKRYEM